MPGAQREGRTPTALRPPDFESGELPLSRRLYRFISRRIGNLHRSMHDLKNRFHLMQTDDYGTNYGTLNGETATKIPPPRPYTHRIHNPVRASKVLNRFMVSNGCPVTVLQGFSI